MRNIKSAIRSFDRRVTKGRIFLAYRGVSGKLYRTIQRMRRNPILVGGSGRSGTTLVASILSAHPKIYTVPEETGAFCPSAYSKEEDLQAAFNIERVYCHLINPNVDLEKYTRWSEKTPKNILFVERLLKYFGDSARFINVVRDGRDVVTSKHPSNPDRYFIQPKEWVRDVTAGRLIDDHPRVITVLYEDIVKDHLPVLRRICDFVGEKFAEEAFKAYPKSAQLQESRAWYGQARKISDRSVGRWKKDEHAEVVSRLYATEGVEELLSYYGYLECN